MSDPALPVREFLESLSVPVLATDANGVIVGSNARARAVLESTDDELEGRPLGSVCSLRETGPHLDAPAWYTSKSGTRFVAQVTTLTAPAAGGDLYLQTFRDVHGAPLIGQEFEDALLELARAPEFVSGDMQAAADFLTAKVAETLDVERVGVWLLSEDGSSLDCISLYESTPERHSRGLKLSASAYPRYFAALDEGRAIAADDAATDPRTSEFAGEYLASLGIASMMDSVIRVSGRVIGVVCHEHVGDQRTWLPNEIMFAGEVADHAAHAYLVAKNARSLEERDRLEATLQQAQRLEAVGRLAGGVAHDFNNLLSVVLGYAELGMDEADAFTRECLSEIHAAGTRAAALTNQLLSIGRRQVLRPRPIDANALITDITSLLRSVVPETIDLALDLNDGPAVVDADRGQLEQVVMNLCLNARDAIEGAGSITVGTQIESAAGGDDCVVISVEDDGIGIPEDSLEHVFDPFFTTKSEGKGTGLGLSMVHGIAAQHGGTATVTSRVGKGSRFEVRLPWESTARVDEDEPGTLDRPPVDARGHLLVVEDGTPLRKLTQTVLTRAGYRVTTASDGLEAVEKHATEPQGTFDLVLLDVIMPQADGPAALEAMRRREPELPALFLTGYGAETLSPDVLDQSGVDFLLKPYETSDLLAAVHRLLRLSRSGGDSA